MNLADIRAQIEDEITWRSDEIRFFRNQLSNIPREEDKRTYRKALAVMLYSHYEGFCKVVLSIYAGAINEEKIKCSAATHCIVAASLASVFKEFENPNKKSEIFKKTLPDDSQLHKYSRQVELISSLADIWSRDVDIPIDSVVDTKSNLWPIELRKILYRLGFPYDIFEEYEGLIYKLINQRHKVAHGSHGSGFDEKEYEDIEKSTFEIFDRLTIIILEALRNGTYLRDFCD